MVFNTPFDNLSFALTFQYINLKTEDQHVFASVKKGANNEDIIYSKTFKLSEFNDCINKINKELEDISISKKYNIDAADMVQKFIDYFLKDTLNVKEFLKNEKESYDSFLQNQREELDLQKLEDTFRAKKKKLTDTQLLIDNTIQKSSDYKELQQLNKRLSELKNNIEKTTDNLRKEYEFDLQVKTVQESKENVLAANESLDRAIVEYKKGAVPSISKIINKRTFK